MRHRAVVALTFALVGLACAASPALGAGQPPVIYNGIYGYAHARRPRVLPGVNNWACKPSTAHLAPVILVHGTFGDMSDSWQALSPLLYDQGYCVFCTQPRLLQRQRGASKVNTLVGLAPSNRGTTLDGLFTLASHFPGSDASLADCPACREQEAGSPFITNLNAGGETNPNVNYTVIESANDEVVPRTRHVPGARPCRCPTTTSPMRTC